MRYCSCYSRTCLFEISFACYSINSLLSVDNIYYGKQSAATSRSSQPVRICSHGTFRYDTHPSTAAQLYHTRAYYDALLFIRERTMGRVVKFI